MCFNSPGIKLEPEVQRKECEIEHLSSYAHIFHTNSSCHIVERTRMSAKFPKLKTESAKPAKLLFFIVKRANL